MSTNVDQIKERLNIVDIVSSYITLEKAGRNLKARCPFHNEKTPSFFVSPERNSYHCFGCNTGGDVFSFVEKMEGVDFREALKILANRAGIPLPVFDTETEKEKDLLYTIHEKATLFFEHVLKKNRNASDYLRLRGITDETISAFRIGFVPDEWRLLLVHLIERGFRESDIEKAGLAIKKENRYYDRFRGRIMFPLSDPSGKIIAFSGRILNNEKEVQGGKYINSPETMLFNKSRVLYGFDKAKGEMRKLDQCVLVEGQMDVLMSYQAGIKNVVAVSGTALSEHHLDLIGRMTKNITLAFDPDTAGINASGRSIESAFAKEFEVRAIKLPPKIDPAELVKKDPGQWRELVEEATHIIHFYIAVLKEGGYDQRIFRKKIEEVVLPYVVLIQSRIDRAHFIQEISHIADLPEEVILEAIKKLEDAGGRNLKKHTPPSLIENGEPETLLEKTKKRIESIFAFLKQGEFLSDEAILKQSEFERLVLGNKALFKESDDAYIMTTLFELEKNEDGDGFVRELDDLMITLKEHILRTKMMKAMNDLKYAEQKGDEVFLEEKTKECNRLSKELYGVMDRG